MIRLGTVYNGLGTSLLAIGPAFAVTLTNQDTKEHTLTIDHEVQEDQQKIAAGADAQVKCPNRCEVRVVGMGDGRLAGGEGKLAIARGGLIRHADEAPLEKSADAAADRK